MVVLSRKKDVNIVEAQLIITGSRLNEQYSSYTFVCELELPKDYINFEGDIGELRKKIEADKAVSEKKTAQYQSALEKLKTL